MAMNSLYGPAGIGVRPNAIAGYDLASIGRKSPEQMGLFNAMSQGAIPGIQQGLGSLSDLASGKESAFQQMEAPAYSALQRAGSQLASQFSGMGMGGRYSSGFQNALAGQAGSLAEQLQAKRMGIQQAALSELLGLGRGLLSEDLFENQLMRKPPTFWETLGGGLSGALGQGGGTLGGLYAANKLGLIGGGLNSLASAGG